MSFPEEPVLPEETALKIDTNKIAPSLTESGDRGEARLTPAALSSGAAFSAATRLPALGHPQLPVPGLPVAVADFSFRMFVFQSC